MKTIEKTQGQQTSSEAILNSIITTGDLSRLTPEQKVDYYRTFCERLGLDPISQPFKLLRLNGREILYCDRTGAQQLNKLHSVSHEIRAREIVNGCYVVTSQASTPDGRHTESIGAVPIENLKGDNLCNAMMKAETKAKRRATLDLLGLGILDETEADVIAPVEAKLPAPVAPKAEVAPVPETPVAEAPKTEERPVELPKMDVSPVELSKAEAPIAVEKIAETTPVDAEKPKKAPVAKASEKLKMLKPDAEITDPMKTKYTTPATLETALGKAYTITHLSDLYYNNIELIEKNAAMKALFTARKLQITNGTLQADAMAA
jgi:hypothetical protein